MLKDEKKLNHEYARQRITINGRTGELIVKEIKKKTKKDRYKDKNQQNQENWYK